MAKFVRKQRLLDKLEKMSEVEVAQVAQDLCTKADYIRHVAYGYRNASPMLAKAIAEKLKLKPADIRPDVFG